MGCKYCGGAIPPKPPGVRGRKRVFCSDQCQHNYFSMLDSRKRRGNTKPPEFCRNCGRVIQYHRTGYCSDECRSRSERPEYSMEGINALRFAALKQAKKEGWLRSWMKRPSFYELFPELTPDQLGGGKL